MKLILLSLLFISLFLKSTSKVVDNNNIEIYMNKTRELIENENSLKEITDSDLDSSQNKKGRYSSYYYSSSNNIPSLYYSIKYEYNNVTGTGNRLIDVLYRAKCDLMKCDYCCLGELNNMECSTEKICQPFYNWAKFLRLLPLIIIAGIMVIFFFILLIISLCAKKDCRKALKFACYYMLLVAFLPITFFFFVFGCDIFEPLHSKWDCCDSCCCWTFICCCCFRGRSGGVATSTTNTKAVTTTKKNNDVVNVNNNRDVSLNDFRTNINLNTNNPYNQREGGININNNNFILKENTIKAPGGISENIESENVEDKNKGILKHETTPPGGNDENFDNNFLVPINSIKNENNINENQVRYD